MIKSAKDREGVFMTLQQILYALTISEKGSMNKAAEALYISQPSLTSAIRELEKDAGISIFLRTGKGVIPTKEGAEFLNYARQVYQQYELLRQKYGKTVNIKRKFGVSTQHYSLFPWMSARKNVAFGIKQVKKNISRAERLKIADEFLDKVGLEDFKNKYPSQLSGGMQQRVAIARALAMDTDILLMDEPFGAIDAKNRTILQELLLELWEGNGVQEKKTVVFVTHDIDEAILLSDRIIMMSASPGRVYKEITVPFERPRNRA